MWQRKNFEEAADQIAGKFVESSGQESINQLATKVASIHSLNPEGIRTLVRLANVSAFEKKFAQEGEKKATDRMFEFEVGDPEVVINNLHCDAKEAMSPTEKTAYDRSSDYYGDLYEAGTVKKASDAEPANDYTKYYSDPIHPTQVPLMQQWDDAYYGRPWPKHMLPLAGNGFGDMAVQDSNTGDMYEYLHERATKDQPFRRFSGSDASPSPMAQSDWDQKQKDISSILVPAEKTSSQMSKATKAQFMAVVRNAKDKCTETAKEAEYCWINTLEKAARLAVTNVQRIEKLAEFEKNAAALLGEDVMPELALMRQLSTKGKGLVFGGEKIAEVIRTQVAVITRDQQPIIGLLKEAIDARKRYETNKRNIAWIDENMAKVN